MTPLTPDDPANDLLHRALGSLTASADQRWVEVAPRVLTAALSATRRSLPVRAHSPHGAVHVSEQVIIAYLRAAIDGTIPGSAVARIHVNLTGRDTFAGVLIEMIIQFVQPILPIADQVRLHAAAALEELLGTAAPHVYVRTSHIHVSDVTPGDPQTTDT